MALSTSIIPVVVTFNPDLSVLRVLAADLLYEADYVVVVDNGSAVDVSELELAGKGRIRVLQLGQNLGIAAAQNRGISLARNLGCDAIVFLDQDSRLPSGFVALLGAGLSDPQVLITAPMFIDDQSGFTYPIVDLKPSGLRRKYYPVPGERLPKVSNAISSGTLVRTEVFDRAGLMDEELFIDYVDTEWCMRCASHGFGIQINTDVQFRHSIGTKSLKVLGLRVPVHSPQRRYYRVRNAFLLLRYPHVPKLLACTEIFFGAIHQMLLIIHEDAKVDYGRHYFRAVRDGLRGVTGPYIPDES